MSEVDHEAHCAADKEADDAAKKFSENYVTNLDVHCGYLAGVAFQKSRQEREAVAGTLGDCVEICWMSLTSSLHRTVAESEKAIRYHFAGLYEAGRASLREAMIISEDKRFELEGNLEASQQRVERLEEALRYQLEWQEYMAKIATDNASRNRANEHAEEARKALAPQEEK